MNTLLRTLRLINLAGAFSAIVSGLAGAPSDFTLTSATDHLTFKLADARGKYVALHFLLKTECPFCLRHTRTYLQKSAGDPRVVHVFIKPDSDQEIRRWAAGLQDQPGLTVYRDSEAALAREFGIPDGYQFHGQVVHYPALVLLGPDGKEVFRYVGKNNTDRLPYEKFEGRLKELTRSAR